MTLHSIIRQLSTLVVAGVLAACGGPAPTDGDPNLPAQSANGYWVGIEQAGALHLHIVFVQTGTALSLQPSCVADRCALYPFNATGLTFVGSDLPVVLTAVTGSFTNPTITFSFTLSNNRRFTFTGRMADDKLMTGKISGPTLPETTITFEKRSTT
ncbi:hypothetical protein [Gemmatimonas sp.]|uniref:hypothetical protein n=1 Tax=Gemmatimonas sp. TaxID=1962908 RepID=UPI003982DD28